MPYSTPSQQKDPKKVVDISSLDNIIEINTAERYMGVGLFLIIDGEEPTLSYVTDKLGIASHEVVTDSFDNL